ncbi:MAG: DUF11 domain-containing protein [Candidatus Eisenbacteria bacterium]|nr:DUF11 domain-containing protein [Candidatus Eisenbacteria bacterium]
MKRSLAFALITAAVLVPALALAEGDVTVSLTANRMIPKPGGQEAATSAEHAKPGDVIEYRATYRNAGNTSVRKLSATLPIPAGTEYLARSASPAPEFASTDGRMFEPFPLTRRVRMPDGREALREVPANEYRSLRWTLGTLAARGQQSVRARVRVSSGTVAALVQH